ncbi:MAG: flagellar hook-basal body complex protein FliE [Planctomycetota bacterium]|jgi:flagellar hook-basal body complex protein FliE
MINLNANVGSVFSKPDISAPKAANAAANKSDFADTIKAIEKHISKVDDLQQSSDMAVKDLLTGKSADISSVVSAVAKADISFKLLVGVRNKLIEAYKQTMNMPL